MSRAEFLKEQLIICPYGFLEPKTREGERGRAVSAPKPIPYAANATKRKPRISIYKSPNLILMFYPKLPKPIYQTYWHCLN